MKKVFTILSVSLILLSCQKESGLHSSEKLLYAKKGELAGIYDQQGRYILLRGVNYNVLGDYWQANPAVATTKPYEAGDIALMARYGFNCIRLLFSWSALEPQRGVYDHAYIQKIKTAIEEAAKYDMYILLDMHQDAWGKYIATPPSVSCEFPGRGWDGAPEWATFTDGESTCTVDGSRESAPAVVHAWGNFWGNTDGIQDACRDAWKLLVKETAQYPNVVGYDLINEPSLGHKPLEQEAAKMSKFYKDLIKDIRAAEIEAGAFQHIIFFEMSVTWNGTALPFIPGPNFTTDENIIFAPHLYFEAISYLLTIEQGFELVKNLSGLYKTNMFIGEWGFFDDPASDAAKLKRFAAQEDKYFTGSTWWQWAQAPGDPHGISWDGTSFAATSLHLLEIDVNGNFTGNINETSLNILGRSRPLAICGFPKLFTSNPDDGTMHLEANAIKSGITVLWIPGRFGEPEVTGTNIELYSMNPVDGGYKAEVKVSGYYSIDISF